MVFFLFWQCFLVVFGNASCSDNFLFIFGQLTNAFFFFFEILRYNATNQHFVEVANGFSLLAHLLERVSPTYLTSETVTAVVNVCARVRFSEYVKSVIIDTCWWDSLVGLVVYLGVLIK